MQLPIRLPQTLKEKSPHVKTVIEVVRGRKLGDKTSYTSHFYVSSLAVGPELVAKLIREHWYIEDRLHWVLDLVFKEDKIKVSDLNGAVHIALSNKVCLNIIRQHHGKKRQFSSETKRSCLER